MADRSISAEAAAEPGKGASRPWVTAEQLLGICADSGNAEAWGEFMQRFHHLIVSIARRTARHYTEPGFDLCDDLTQEVYLKLNANNRRLLREFVPRHEGSAYGYISVVTANVVHDYFKGKGRIRRYTVLPDMPAPGNVGRDLLLHEIDDLLRQHTSETNREVFWLYYRHGMTAKEIAALPNSHLGLKGVESVLSRLGARVRARFADEQRKTGSQVVFNRKG
jgi:RNA polymerase sigma-70 factor, ECF subfamily